MTIFHGNIFRWGGSELSQFISSDLDAKWMSVLMQSGTFEPIAEYQVGEKRSPWHHMRFVSPDPITPLHRILRAERNNSEPFRYEVLFRVNELTGMRVQENRIGKAHWNICSAPDFAFL